MWFFFASPIIVYPLWLSKFGRSCLCGQYLQKKIQIKIFIIIASTRQTLGPLMWFKQFLQLFLAHVSSEYNRQKHCQATKDGGLSLVASFPYSLHRKVQTKDLFFAVFMETSLQPTSLSDWSNRHCRHGQVLSYKHRTELGLCPMGSSQPVLHHGPALRLLASHHQRPHDQDPTSCKYDDLAILPPPFLCHHLWSLSHRA